MSRRTRVHRGARDFPRLWVVADEVYATLTFERPHISIASLPGMAERTITISSLSKSHAMPGGARLGRRSRAPDRSFGKDCPLHALWTTGFIQAGALAALEEGADAGGYARDLPPARI